MIAGTMRLIALFSRLVGLHPDFPLGNFHRETGLELTKRMPANLLGYWTLVLARNNKILTANGSPNGVTA